MNNFTLHKIKAVEIMHIMDRFDLEKSSKFTRGEKCIFIHLILTFVLIILSIIIYFVHLCLINHPGNSYLNTRRSVPLHDGFKVDRSVFFYLKLNRPNSGRSQQHLLHQLADTTGKIPRPHKRQMRKIIIPDYLPIGVLYLNTNPIRVICNTILFREKWSIAPAHCVIIRNDPSLVQLLPKWEIKFKTADLKFRVTKIRRSIAHPHFNRDDFRNNIGLLEHIVSVPIHQYITFNRSVNLYDYVGFGDRRLRMGSWNEVSIDDKENIEESHSLYVVNLMERAKCVNFMAAVVDLRSYEHCFTLHDTSKFKLYHGAALLNAFDVFGIFSWGERQNKIFPFVILRIADFKDWLEDVIYLNSAV